MRGTRRVRMMAAALAAGVLGSWAVSAGEVEDAGRAVFEKNRQAVVTVQFVVKEKFSMLSEGSEERESKREATGCVIAPSGLTVVSLTAMDPVSASQEMMSAMDADGQGQLSVESNVTDARILLEDGTELPARVVLRDKDLDLAFLRPVQPPSGPLAAIDTSGAGQAGLLDPVIALNRLGRVAGRTAAVCIERIQAIIKRPRTFYVPGNDPTYSSLGSPVFTLDGNLLGIIVFRVIKSAGGPGEGLSDMDNNVMAIVAPTADILEAASQAQDAPAATPEEPQGSGEGEGTAPAAGDALPAQPAPQP